MEQSGPPLTLRVEALLFLEGDAEKILRISLAQKPHDFLIWNGEPSVNFWFVTRINYYKIHVLILELMFYKPTIETSTKKKLKHQNLPSKIKIRI